MNPYGKLIACVPYLFVLAAAAALWRLTFDVTFDAQPGQLSPTFWPRLAIGLMAISALVEMARLALAKNGVSTIAGIGRTLERSGDDDTDDGDLQRRPLLLIGGVALTLGFAGLVTTLGFLPSTFIFLVVFMYLGGYRNHAVIWLSAVIGTLVFAIVFLKVVYVSLPRGTAPFDQVTQAVVDLLAKF